MKSIAHFHLGGNLSGVGQYIDVLRRGLDVETFVIEVGSRNAENVFQLRNSELITFLGSLCSLIGFIKEGNIGILHVHTLRALAYSVTVYPVLRYLGVAIVYTGHGIRFDQLKGKGARFTYHKIERLCLCFVDFIVYIRKYDYELGVARFGFLSNSLYVPTRIDYKQTRERPRIRGNDQLRIISVGSLDENKDPMRFIDIAKNLANEQKNLDFTWVGEGPLMDKCLDRLKQLNLSNIHFPGELDNKKVREMMETSQIYLCTSKIETFPITFIEALSNSLKILSTPLRGLEEEFGDVVSFIDGEDMLQHILFYYENPEKLGLAGNKSEEFYLKNLQDEKAFVSAHVKIYARV